MSTTEPETHQNPQATVTAPIPAAGAHTASDATRVMPNLSGMEPSDDTRTSTSKPKHKRKSRSSRGGAHRARKPRRRGRGCLIALIVVIVLIAAVYAGGVAIFSNIYYPGTTIAGADISLIDAGSAATRIRSVINHYSLTIEGSDFTWTYEPKSVDDLIDADDVAQSVLEENDPFLWPLHLYEALTATDDAGETTVTTDATTEDLTADPDFSLFSDTFDEAAFEESLGAAIDSFNEGRSGTFDIESVYDTDSHTFSAEKAKSNELLARDTIIAYAKHELSQLAEDAPLSDLGDDAFEPLADGLSDSNVQDVCDAMNNLLGADFDIMLNGEVATEIGPDQIAQWVVLGDDLTPSLDQDAITSLATEIADGFNTVGTERTYTREDGKEITVSGGTFGWEVDTDALVTAIVDAINNKSTDNIDVPTSQAGDVYNGQGQRDWGAYVDVDISEQHAYYYDADGNLLWESGIITGNPTKGNDTPTGVYYLQSKSTDVTLRGPVDPDTGEYEWESEVDYWMPFKSNSWGLHDASWQAESSFENKDAYKTVGSHGCVNLPPDKAAELYELIEPGTAVIVHD